MYACDLCIVILCVRRHASLQITCTLYSSRSAWRSRAVSQLLNLNMQRGCHGTPRANTFNRGSILKSRALNRSRRFRYYDACCCLFSSYQHFGGCFCNMSTVPNDARWMDVGPPSLEVPFHACIQYVYVLPMYIFFPIIRVLAIFQFLVVPSLYRNAYT